MDKNYVQDYLSAYKEMKDAAIEKMKNYGKVLEVYKACEQKLMERKGYKSVKEIDEDEFDDFKWSNTYSCAFEGKHGHIYCCHIVMIRYNENTEDVEVYLESDEGDIAEWFNAAYIGFDNDAIYMTIHDFCE